MKPLGRVVNVSSSGMLIIRSDVAPRIGKPVCDKGKFRIGRISRVTGPADKPYVIVKPTGKSEHSLTGIVGRDLFLDDEPSKKRGGQRRGKSRGYQRKPSRDKHGKGRKVHHVKNVRRRT